MSFRSLVFVALASLAVLAALATPGWTAQSQPFDVTASKHPNGKYVAGIQDLTISAGITKTVFWKVENTAGGDLNMSFRDAVTSTGSIYHKINWFKSKRQRKATKITHAVKNEGYEFLLKAGKSKFFNARVRAKTDDEGLCLGGRALDNPQSTSEAAYFQVNGFCP